MTEGLRKIIVRIFNFMVNNFMVKGGNMKELILVQLIFLDEVYDWIVSLRYDGWQCFKILYI